MTHISTINGFRAGDWVTNEVRSIRAFWPRREGVVYHEGPPKATERYTVDELRARNIVGIYVTHDYPDYWSRPRTYAK